MHIEHIAIWTNDIEKLKEFYIKYFGCEASARYENPRKRYSSYFLSFDGGARLEIMKREDITASRIGEMTGLAHFSIAVGSDDTVDKLTQKMENDGVIIDSWPRTTGDGYYESVVLDPDNNKVEIMSAQVSDYPDSHETGIIDKNIPVVIFSGDSFHANMVKNLLENEGIVAYITNEIVGTALPWHIAPGGFGAIKVTVASGDYERAKIIVGEFENKLNE